MRPIKFNISRNLIGLMNSNSIVQVKIMPLRKNQENDANRIDNKDVNCR